MSRFLNALADELKKSGRHVIRVSAAGRDGEIETIELSPAARCQNVYSVAKPFTMTAIGILFDRGLLKPEDRITDILASELPPSGMDEQWKNATCDMALKHRLGLPAGFLDIDVCDRREFTDDFLRYTLTYPLVCAPGEKYIYTDGAYYILARIAEKVSGRRLDDLLWESLLLPLGVREAAFSHCPMGHAIGATGLYIHTEDMVKLGLLYRDKGLFNGRRVLSQRWVDMALEREYAFSWEANGRAFAKGGMYAQQLIVCPENGLVAAIQAFDSGTPTMTDFVAGWIE